MPLNKTTTKTTLKTSAAAAPATPSKAELAAAEALLKAAAEAEAADKAAKEAAEAAKTAEQVTAFKHRVDAIAAVLCADEDFNNDVEQSIIARDITMRGPCAYLVGIERLLTADMMASLPVPGTDEKSAPNNPDKYWDLVNGKRQKSSYYLDLARLFPAGKVEQETIQHCAMYEGKNPDCPEHIKDLTGQQVDDKKKNATRRLGNLAELLRKAVRLHNAIALIREKLPKVEIKLVMVDGVLYDSPQPILVNDKDTPSNGEFVSADTVLGYRIEHAAKQAGENANGAAQYKALRWSGGKQTATPSGNGAPGATAASGMAPKIANIHKFFESLMEVVAYIKKPEHQKLILARFSADDGDANLELIGDMSVECDALITGPLEEKYKRIKAERAAADKAKDAATATKGATKTAA